MKWREAYQCKKCGKIHKHRQAEFCRCGTKITWARPRTGYGLVLRHATKMLQPIVARRRWFKWETRPSTIPEWLIQGKPPPIKGEGGEIADGKQGS